MSKNPDKKIEGLERRVKVLEERVLPHPLGDDVIWPAPPKPKRASSRRRIISGGVEF